MRRGDQIDTDSSLRSFNEFATVGLLLLSSKVNNIHHRKIVNNPELNCYIAKSNKEIN